MPHKIVGQVRTVPIDSVVPNTWNPNRQSAAKFEQTCKVIKQYGFLDPCTVRSGRPKGKKFAKLEIIDGEHRWRAAKELGYTEILVEDVGRMADAVAKTLTDIMNNLQGENDPARWADMVEQIRQEDAAYLEFLPYEPAEFEMLEATARGWDEQPSGKPDKPPAGDELFRKFSVSLPPDLMTRAKDVMRRIKAAHASDSDAQAFAHLLDGYEAQAGAARAGRGDTDPKPPPKRRKRSRAA